MAVNGHTIVLTQTTKDSKTKHYADYETLSAALDGICMAYELRLKQENPGSTSITYDISDLLAFLDRLADLSCLVWNDQLRAYRPFGRDWIKGKIYQQLRRQAGQAD